MNKKSLIVLLTVFLVAVFISACGSSSAQNDDVDNTTELDKGVNDSDGELNKSNDGEALDENSNQGNNVNEDSSDDEESDSLTKENETNKGTSEEETNVDQNVEQKNKDNSRTQSDNQDTEITTVTPENDQEKAISLVRDYLRNKYDDFIEDKDNFLAYDGEIKGYVIVRYATLVSGHTSTNGRYAVNIKNGKVVDFTGDNMDSLE